jgi:hypothetical protein
MVRPFDKLIMVLSEVEAQAHHLREFRGNTLLKVGLLD